jgi:hypothetical protein
MLQKLLEKISWKTRKWNLKIQFFTLYLHDSDGCWGFELLSISNNFIKRSLLRLEFRLPNKTTVKVFHIDSWDILFMSYYLWRRLDNLEDRQMWSRNLSTWEKLQVIVLQKLMK